jgi:outer membrane protein assembly factor BamB
MIDRAWMYAAAGLLWVGLGQGTAGERAKLPTVDGSRVAAPLSQQVGRTPPLTLSRLSVRGRLQVATDLGVPASDSVIVEDHGDGGYLDVLQGPQQDFAGAPQVEVLGDGRYRVTIATSDMQPAGTYRGTLRLRMCAETPCVHPIANTGASAPYRIDVAWVNPGEWEMFQRDAAHTGYVPVPLRASRITKSWEYVGSPGHYSVAPGGVATGEGRAFLSQHDGQEWAIGGLHAVDGSVAWIRQLDELNAPAYSQGRVYASTDDKLWSFDATDGAPVFGSSIPGAWNHVLSPTISGGIVYTNAGYYGGNGIHAYDADDGLPLWLVEGYVTGTTPAVRGDKVYYYDADKLRMFDAFDGTAAGEIADPNEPIIVTDDLRRAPMLGSTDHVIMFSGTETSPFGRFLVDYSPATGTARWRTAKKYFTDPATAGGVIYAGSNNPKSFDAIDEATGAILWSWVPPSTSDLRLQNNIVLTRNLAFVSTNRAVYAIDLSTRQPVWSYPVSGTLSISGDGRLYLMQTSESQSGRIIAFRLY